MLKVGDLVKLQSPDPGVGRRLGVVIKISTASVHPLYEDNITTIRVHWVDGLKWGHLPDSLIKLS